MRRLLRMDPTDRWSDVAFVLALFTVVVVTMVVGVVILAQALASGNWMLAAMCVVVFALGSAGRSR